MVDPLAVAALGLTVTKGLLKVAQTWKGLPSDIQAAAVQLEQQRQAFDNLQELLKRRSLPSDLKDSLDEALKECHEKLQKLEVFLEKLEGGAQRSKVHRMVSKGVRRVALPLKKQELQDLLDVIKSLGTILSTKIQVLHLHDIEGLQNIISSELQLTRNTITTLSADIKTGNSSEHQIKAEIETIRKDMSTAQQIDNVEKSLLNLSNLISQAFGPEKEDIAHNAAQAARKAILSEQDRQDRKSDTILKRSCRTKTRCGSKPYQKRFIAPPGLQIEFLDLLEPYRDIFSTIKEPESHNKPPEIWPWLSWMLNSVHSTFFAKHGAGMWSFKYSLTQRHFRVEHSEAVEQIHALGRRVLFALPSPDSLKSDFQRTTRELAELFHTERASPFDMCEANEQGICQAAANVCHLMLFFLNNPSRYENAVLGFFCALLKLGVPPNEQFSFSNGTKEQKFSPPCNNKSVPEFYLESGVSESFFLKLFELGFDIVDGNPLSGGLLFGTDKERQQLKKRRIENSDLAFEFGFNEISLAVISRNKGQLQRAIQFYQDVDETSSFWRETPLHVACEIGWHDGINILMDSNASPNIWGETIDSVLSCAIKHCSAQVVSLLLRNCTDSPEQNVRFELGAVLSGPLHDRLEEEPKVAAEIADILISEHLRRRLLLANLGRRYLPKETWNRLQIDGSSMLDSCAWQVFDALSETISVPPHLMPLSESPGRSVYHSYGGSYGFSPLIAEKLWQAGFYEVDEPDIRGWTPLCCICNHYSEKAMWLISKGASIAKALNPRRICVAHIVGSHLGRNAWQKSSNLGAFMATIGERNQLENLTDLRDNCRCACAPDGCNFFTKFIRTDYDFHNIETLLFILRSDKRRWRKEFLRVFRALLFQHLNLTHVCCSFEYWRCYQESSESDSVFKVDDEAEDIMYTEKLDEEELGRHVKLASTMLSYFNDFVPFFRMFCMREVNSACQQSDNDLTQVWKDFGVDLQPLKISPQEAFDFYFIEDIDRVPKYDFVELHSSTVIPNDMIALKNFPPTWAVQGNFGPQGPHKKGLMDLHKFVCMVARDSPLEKHGVEWRAEKKFPFL